MELGDRRGQRPRLQPSPIESVAVLPMRKRATVGLGEGWTPAKVKPGSVAR